MTPAVVSAFVPAKRAPQNILPPIPTNSSGAAPSAHEAIPTPAVLAAAPATIWRLKESGSAAVLVCATFRLQKPKIKKKPYYLIASMIFRLHTVAGSLIFVGFNYSKKTYLISAIASRLGHIKKVNRLYFFKEHIISNDKFLKIY